MIDVIDSRGRTLTPCRRKVAEREVRLARAKWVGPNKIRLRFDPFAYRYIRLKVLSRDNHTCYWCKLPGDTMDHIIPWSKGGRTTMENCICACQECNGQRGDMPPDEFARLRNVPSPRPLSSPRPLEAPRLLAAPRPVAKLGPVAVPVAEQPRRPRLQRAVAVVAEVTRSFALMDLLDPYGPSHNLRQLR